MSAGRPGFSDYSYSTMEFNWLTSASHMSLPEAGYGSEEGQLGSEISGAVSGVTTPGASRLQASQSQERSATMQRLHGSRGTSEHKTLSKFFRPFGQIFRVELRQF